MNHKILAITAILVLFASVMATSLINSAYAQASKDTINMNATGKATSKEVKEKASAKKQQVKEKVQAKKQQVKEKVSTKKEQIKENKEAKSTATASPSDKASVEIASGSSTNTNCGDQCYKPSSIEVKKGTTITWKNADTAAHTVTSGKDTTADGTFDSGLIAADKTFSFKFEKPGTYDYFCIVHPWMKATVQVS